MCHLNELTPIVIMLIAGGLGGLVNFLFSEIDSEEETGRILFKHLILGIVASFSVPLFLSTIQSNLLEDVSGVGSSSLVFLGFCLLAAVGSRAFIQQLSKRSMQMISDFHEDSKRIAHQMDGFQKSNTEVSLDEDEISSVSFLQDKKGLPYLVLAALVEGKFSLRTIKGLCAEFDNLEEGEILSAMETLRKVDLVDFVSNDKKQMLWFATGRGKAFVWRQD